MRIRIYAKNIPNKHKRDYLYPVGHLSLLSPEDTLKFARFLVVRTERNKRLINMSAKLRSGGSRLFNIVQSCSILFLHSKFALQR